MIDFSADFGAFRSLACRAIDQRFDSLATQTGAIARGPLAEDRAFEAARYAMAAGGKRLRGILVLSSAAACAPPNGNADADADQTSADGDQTSAEGDQTSADALTAAVSIELMHGYSLLHDDLPAMDDDDLRRGRPTTHRAFDEATAILAGDGLQAMAFQCLAQCLEHTDPIDALQLVAELSASAGFGGMVGGQMLDILAETRDQPFDLDTTKRLQAKKTGALIRYSCRAGAILSGERGDALAHLDRFGAKLGLAFQIVDDLLDLRGDAAVIGKATSKDLGRAKATFIDHLGEQGARDEVARLVQGARQSAEFLRKQANSSSQQNAINQLVNIAQFVATRHY